MRLRSRRLLETLPLACHDADSGVPRHCLWRATLSEGAVREEASGTGSGALVVANVF